MGSIDDQGEMFIKQESFEQVCTFIISHNKYIICIICFPIKV